ncbi:MULTISPECIES: hypothetical protein [unclassified Aureispira]|uniref:hypothetical protein n=1 Tax=unclassified Aureispira TaxID=2649989 RepID=UPI00069830D6|nr:MULTISPECIES: hypothetical protein [unclassified Aureispira]WMX14491.1 hypothetical protein QP953_26910 [Aureispira sp. CCB-E]
MGTNIGRFFMGFIMFIGGLYLMLNSIRVDIGTMFHGRYSLFNVGGIGVTSGSIMLVFMLGVGMLFFNARNPLAWIVTVGSLAALIFGVIANTHFSLQYMSAFDLIVILVLLCGGLGLLLSSMSKRNAS